MRRHTRSGAAIVVAIAAAAVASSVAAAGADVKTITHGAEVDLEDHLVAGKYVLFDFYADWCAPCRSLEPVLGDLADRHSDRLALRKVDVINWGSPVARQHGLRSIPFMVLYGPDGRVVSRGGAGAVLSALESALGGGSAVPSDSEEGGPGPLIFILAATAVAVALLLRRRGRPAEADHGSPDPDGAGSSDAAGADPRVTAVWLTMLDGCLEGPFTVDQLSDLRRRSCVAAEGPVRRKGDTVWRTVADVLHDESR